VALNKDVDHLALLVNCSPQILVPPIDLQEHLVQMPCITNRPSALFKRFEYSAPNFRHQTLTVS
jgi:hypothetical protein